MVPGCWYSDTIYFSVKSITRKETSAQIFTNGKGFDIVYPIESVKQCHQALVNFIQEHGIPQILVVNGHKSQASHDTYDTQWGKIIREYQVKQSWIQPYCWWQNGAERVVGEIRRDMRSLQSIKQSPKRLWAYLVQYICG